jgi:hypothetical protein
MHWEKEGVIIDSIGAGYGRTLLGWTSWTGLTGLIDADWAGFFAILGNGKPIVLGSLF